LNREQKANLIAQLEDGFKSSAGIVVCDYKGMSVKELEALRTSAKAKNVTVRVLNNKLASIAFKNSNIEGLVLDQTNIGLWGEDQIAVCKVAVDFAKSNDKLIVKFGAIEGEAVDIAKVEAFAKLPGRDELLGMLLSVWTGPSRYFVTAMDNLKKQKEEA